MKKCPSCESTKPDSDFYGNKPKLSSYCKDCTIRLSKQWSDSNRKRKLEINRQWRLRNPARRKLSLFGSNRVWKALKDGVLVRGTICSKCGSSDRIEAAHSDYSSPLNVLWLCIKCHRAWDAKVPKTQNAQSGYIDGPAGPKGGDHQPSACPAIEEK